MSEDKPTPRPPIPSPAALASRMHARPPAAVAPVAHSDSARFGRVEEDGTVYVTTGEGERAVGSYPGASAEEALQYFARKYDELASSADLLEARLANPDVPAKEIADGLKTLRAHLVDANVVGDLAELEATADRVGVGLETKRAVENEHRAAARAEASQAREVIVAEAEKIAGQPAGSTQWKTSGEQMRILLEQWKEHQRSGVKLDKSTESALWQRFSHARNAFDKARRSWFAEVETTRAEAKVTKQRLAAEAEALSSSTDWNASAKAFKQLMDQWRSAGRAARSDDDALWERFRAAQDAFFNAKDELVAAEEADFRVNLTAKEELLVQAEALLPVTDVESAKSALRTIQDRWDEAGKVPRADLERVEKRMRRVETAVREADEKRWRSSNPEAAARARSMVDQLEAKVTALEAEVARAEAAGDAGKLESARGRLTTQQEWLTQARAGLDEFGG
ncbi:MAG: DUF349 domain-containing protein [Ornithinibacter sp.]